MFFRAILLLVLSPVTLGAGVSIELSGSVSIISIEYTPPSVPEVEFSYIESSWQNVEQNHIGLDSFQGLRLSHPNSRIGVLVESIDLGLNWLYSNGKLNVITVNPNGSQKLSTYPALEAGFSDYGLRNGSPYLLDKESDTIWEWGVNHWNDIRISQNLPSGHYYSAVPYSAGYFIATADKQEGVDEPEAPNQLWDAGDSTQEIPIIGQVEDSKYINTPDGALQVYNKNLSNYTGHWLDNNEPDFIINVNAVDYPFVNSATSNAGTFMEFFNLAGESKMIWIPVGSLIGESIEAPLGMNSFNGCFAANKKIFCMMNVDGLGFTLYEMEGGEFVLDTQLNETVADKTINGIYSIGGNRYISAFEKGSSGNRAYLYLANGEEVAQIYQTAISTSQEVFFLLPSEQELGLFYWIGLNAGSTIIYKAEASGDFTFKRNLDSIVPIESSAEESSGGSGSMPTYLLVMLLMLLLPSVRWRQVSGV